MREKSGFGFSQRSFKEELSALPRTCSKDDFAKIGSIHCRKGRESSCSHESFSPQQHPAPSRSPAGSASSGESSREQEAAASLAQIAQIRNTPRLESSGMHQAGKRLALLAYRLFIQGKRRCNQSYTLNFTDKIVCQNLGWSFLSQY